jgi:hypothetical protein
MHDEEVERYLAEFKPRRVRALEVPGNKRVWPLRLVAAAVIFLVGGSSLWYLRQETQGVKDALSRRHVLPTTAKRASNLNAIALTKLALEDNEHFEALLADRSQTALPSFQGENSTLRVLAKE